MVQTINPTVDKIDNLLAYDDEIVIVLFLLFIFILIGVVIYCRYKYKSNITFLSAERSVTVTRTQKKLPPVNSEPDKALLGPSLNRPAKDTNLQVTKKTLIKDGLPNNLPVVQTSTNPTTPTTSAVSTQIKQLPTQVATENISTSVTTPGPESIHNLAATQPAKTTKTLLPMQSQPTLQASTVKPLSVRASATQEILLLLPADKSILTSTISDGSRKSLPQQPNSTLKKPNPIRVEMSHLLKMIKD